MHLKSYIETGNVWDPDEEEELRKRLKLEDVAEGGENEERKLHIDIDEDLIEGKLP